MDVHFSNLLRLLKNGQKPNSFSDYFKHNFNSITSNTDLCKCLNFYVVKKLNPIGSMKRFMKPNFSSCM